MGQSVLREQSVKLLIWQSGSDHSPIECLYSLFGLSLSREDNSTKSSRLPIRLSADICPYDIARCTEEIFEVLPLAIERKLWRGATSASRLERVRTRVCRHP
jgi:hypothetical protein